MAFEVDEDILQDFLVEASEILEQLSEQLVDLEKRPDDKNLLNAIFRGFHTVKGGAGFLSLTELVDVCHGAENLFDMLRNGKRTLSAELMDVILQALDAINVMFAQVQNREPTSPASADLLHDLHELCKPEGQEQLRTASVAAQPAPEPEPEPAPEPEPQPEPEPPPQAEQDPPPISGVLLQPVTAPDAPDNPPWRHLALGLGLATITAGGAWRQRRKAML